MAKDRVERDEEDLVRLYLTDIGQYMLLTKDDEVRLAKQIEAGKEAIAELDSSKDVTATRNRELRRSARDGEEAERAFVQSNLRLVVSIAKKYQASGLPLLDLIQEGNLGLMHAVEKFDWRKGFKFSTYATWWIRQAITRGIANTGRTIRLPVHAGDTLARLQKARSRLELKLGRPATLSELAREVEMPEDKVTEALRFAAEPLSLSEPLREDGDAELGDVVEDRSAESPFEVAATALLPEEIARLLAPLDEREREILKLRFGLDRGEPRTLEEVGEHFNLTRERIRQIEARAMSKLRHPSSDTGRATSSRSERSARRALTGHVGASFAEPAQHAARHEPHGDAGVPVQPSPRDPALGPIAVRAGDRPDRRVTRTGVAHRAPPVHHRRRQPPARRQAAAQGDDARRRRRARGGRAVDGAAAADRPRSLRQGGAPRVRQRQAGGRGDGGTRRVVTPQPA